MARTLGRRFLLAGAVLAAALAPAGLAQGMGPALPPGFYGELPDPFPGPKAPKGIQRLAFVYTESLVGETDPCG